MLIVLKQSITNFILSAGKIKFCLKDYIKTIH